MFLAFKTTIFDNKYWMTCSQFKHCCYPFWHFSCLFWHFCGHQLETWWDVCIPQHRTLLIIWLALTSFIAEFFPVKMFPPNHHIHSWTLMLTSLVYTNARTWKNQFYVSVYKIPWKLFVHILWFSMNYFATDRIHLKVFGCIT